VLATTEAVTGLGLGYLSQNEQRIAETRQRIAAIEKTAGNMIRLDAESKSLLEMSPFLLDLVVAEARCRGTAVLTVENCHGMPFIADLALRARNTGITLLVLYSGDMSAPGHEPNRMGKVLVDGMEVQGGALSDPKVATAAVMSRLAQHGIEFSSSWTDADQNEGARLLLIGYLPGQTANIDLAGLYGEIGEEKDGAAWQSAAAWPVKLGVAMRGHIISDRADFAFFTKCVSRIWAPTSERSRGQQG
jgi:hypothetical protein